MRRCAVGTLSDVLPHLPDLLVSGRHPQYLTRHRVDAIIDRVRLVAAAFSGLTLLWIALDALTLDATIWKRLAWMRVASAIVFVWLAVLPWRPSRLGGARLMLAVLLAVPLGLSVAAQVMLGAIDLAGPALVNARLYQSLPFVVIAGLGIFPLVVSEALAFAVPVLAAGTLGPILSGGADWADGVSTLWMLALILGVYMLAGMIQLNYMMALLRRASVDPLTGAFTRRSGTEIIDLQFRMAREQKQPFALVFFDLDNFKSINDRYGHDEGDCVLRGAARSLMGHLRRGDAVIRWGGEEFVAVLPGADRAGARIVVERVLDQWLGVRPDGDPVTASMGAAERVADGAEDWPELVDLADRRMYQAKMGGKAHCVLAEDIRLMPPPTHPAFPFPCHPDSR